MENVFLLIAVFLWVAAIVVISAVVTCIILAIADYISRMFV